jgi:hypothetical protein
MSIAWRHRLAIRFAVAVWAAACLVAVASPRPVAQSDPQALAHALPQLRPDPRLDWWREARFGLFIHWGLDAIPAGEWNGRTDYGEWIRNIAKLPIDVYDRFQARFDPAKFDPDAWVRMAKVRNLADIASKGGHFLLNVGPTAEGEFSALPAFTPSQIVRTTTASAFDLSVRPRGKRWPWTRAGIRSPSRCSRRQAASS